MKTVSLLVVDDEEVIVKLFERLARKEKLNFAAARNGYEALDFLTKNDVECVLLDINLPAYSGFQVLEFIKNSKKTTEVVLITGQGSVEHAVKALKMGAFDYLTKPFDDLEKVVSTIRNAVEKYRLIQKIQELQEPIQPRESFQGIIGRSTPMQDVYKIIQSIKGSNAPVLIEGESGTGKEMVAQAIHATSKRAGKPFVVINCAAIPESLLESELFGHVKGAFTGAISDKKGLFEEADTGTIFLDEIGEVSSAFQVKLLRVLQNGEFKRVGHGENRRTDVRVIAATNRNLKEMIVAGQFREDLFYRLHVIGMNLPALRERKEDVPLLAYHFLEKCNRKMNRRIKDISIDAMQILQNYSWIGNVRELENIIERSVVLLHGNEIGPKDLPGHILNQTFFLAKPEEVDWARFTYQEAKRRAISLFNKSYLRNLLKETGGNISLASNRAGLDRSNFKKIIKKYDIDVGEFRRN